MSHLALQAMKRVVRGESGQNMLSPGLLNITTMQRFSFLSPSVEEGCRGAAVCVWIWPGKANPGH